MTERPYDEGDLRREAARQHAALTADPDFMGIGETMQDQEIIPGGGVNWDELGEENFDAAQRSIDSLLSKAADISVYAIDCGAEGLRPAGHHLVHGDEGGPVRAAFHIALDPHLELDRRTYGEIADLIRANLSFRGES